MTDVISQNSQKLIWTGAILVSMLTIFQQSPRQIDPKLEVALDPTLLLQTPFPRIVKMGWPIKLQIAVVVLFFIGIFGWWAGDSAAPSNHAGYLERFAPIFIFFLLLAIVFLEVVKELQNRWLLAFGNCVEGRVVDQIKAIAGRRRRSIIVYQFAVGPGKPMTARGTDYTRSYSKNSKILVFFDPERLERNVAMCSTGWRVAAENGRILEP